MVFIAKQKACPKYIYKIHSTRLREAQWKLTLPLSEAKRNDEVISIADSQMLRWIDELNGVTDADEKAHEIRSEIRRLRKEPDSVHNRHEIRKLYDSLDSLQFKPDYMCLIVDKNSDYLRACKGFTINGIRYARLLGTSGGIKNSTIVFVCERLAGVLRGRIDCGRDLSKPAVPAKLEAYRALTCSASAPVSMPRGIAVVNDCETTFKANILYATDENGGEPELYPIDDYDIKLNASDGCGMMLPSLAERWSQELGLDYVTSGVNTRLAYTKGMAYAFDFVDFATEVAGSFIIKDAWGNDVDVRDVELILTTSMVKLWDSYKSCEDFLENCKLNKYSFGITKVCPKRLENERGLNYQFIQPMDLSDSEIDELIAPTTQQIRDVLGEDWAKTVLFLRGPGLTAENVVRSSNDIAKAIMIDHRMVNDPFVRSTVYSAIKKRIDEAKVGVINVHGNYSIVSGDLYALCQSIFGLPVTGLLQSGEIYNQYWVDDGASQLACFRAPMSCINNIRSVVPASGDRVRYWYRYMTTCTVFNAWDTAMIALDGMDFDGDMVMLTDNPVLVHNVKELPAIMCVQRKAEKRVSTEQDFIDANIASFGNDIGAITNRVTSMYEVRSHFESDSEEYKLLSYRIRCGQLFQQNAIDRVKGIICKPMPKEWYDYHAVNKIKDAKKKKLYRSILADKKPYFMRYIYPALMKQYNSFNKNVHKNSVREFGVGVCTLKAMPHDAMNSRQAQFVDSYDYWLPVGVGNCVVNRICEKVECEFDGCLRRYNRATDFDYSILRSCAAYDQKQYRTIKGLYDDYARRLRDYKMSAERERVVDYDLGLRLKLIQQDFLSECTRTCSNAKELCNIVLDICYSNNLMKKFAWSICGDEIIDNLLEKNGGKITFPSMCESGDGDITYNGESFHVDDVTVFEGEMYI